MERVDRGNPRPGLRRWVTANTALDERSAWREAWASIHHDGSVTLAAVVGGHRNGSDSYLKGRQVRSTAVESAVADLMALLRVTATAVGATEYDVRGGIEWSGKRP